MDLTREADFFKEISALLLQFVDKIKDNPKITVRKEIPGDFATNVDTEVEEKIVSLLKKAFPEDSVLAEEGQSETNITRGRVWIIDPICGTINLERGLQMYCTNIALASDGELIASCVVDYCTETYYWSIGDNQIFKESSLLSLEPRDSDGSVLVDIDLGATYELKDEQIDSYSSLIGKLLKKTGWILNSLNSSVGFLYVAIGKLDGVYNVANKPWDVAASVFLVRQSGGAATDFQGNDWDLSESKGLILTRDAKVHKVLLDTHKELP